MTRKKSKTISLSLGQPVERLAFVASVLRELSKFSLDAKLALGGLNKVQTALKHGGIRKAH